MKKPISVTMKKEVHTTI